MAKKLYKIGITGGIASGKSKLLNYIAMTQPRIYTINLDLFGHSIYKLNPIVVRNIKYLFGCVNDSTVNWEQLAQIVFKDPQRLKTLSSLVSPEIKRLLRESMNAIDIDKYDAVAVEGAVIIEAKTLSFFDEIWVTTLDKEEAV